MPARFKGSGERPRDFRFGGGNRGERRSNNVKCFKCNGSGHFASQCRSSAATTSCGRCGRRGHNTTDCRTRKENISPKCSHCGKFGHTVGSCRFKNNRGIGASNGPRPTTRVFTCFNCGKEGHKANACKSRENQISNVRDKKCHNCGEAGHLKRDCLKDKRIENAHKGQWPQTRRIPKNVTMLPKRDGVIWMKEEIGHAIELVRILEVVIDNSVVKEKLAGRIERARDKPKTVDIWFRADGTKSKKTLMVDNVGKKVDMIKSKAISDDIGIALNSMKVVQEKLFSCVLDNSFRCAWNVDTSDQDSDMVRNMIEKAKTNYEQDGSITSKLETAVCWVNMVTSTAHQICDEAVRDEQAKNAALLAKAQAIAATQLVQDQGSQEFVAQGSNNVPRRNEAGEQERKRLREERFNSAVRAVYNPFVVEH